MRIVLVLACVLLAGCGVTTNSDPTAPSAAPTGTPGTGGAAAPTTVATAPAPAPTAPPTAARATTSPAGVNPTSVSLSPASSGVTLTVDPASSQARYHAHEQLVGRTLPSEAVGTSNDVSGSIVLDADGSIAADQSKVTVDVSKLTSDESRRDSFIKFSTLQTSRFPTASFVPREAQGLPALLPTDGQLTFQLAGDLTVHGVTRPVTWSVVADFTPSNVSGTATTNVNISDFGMTPPKAGPVLSIEDGLTLELAFSAARA